MKEEAEGNIYLGRQLEGVEFPRVVAQDFFDQIAGRVFPRSHGGDELRLLNG